MNSDWEKNVDCKFGESCWMKNCEYWSNCWILINLNDKSEFVDLSGLYRMICFNRHKWINFSGVVPGKYVKTISLIERHEIVSFEFVDDVVLYDIISFSWKTIDRQYEFVDLHRDDEIILFDEHLLLISCFFFSRNIKTSF